MENLDDLRYPIGHFECPENISQTHISDWIETLETLPKRLENLVQHFSVEHLETPYRPGGWTVRQVVHHIADSHHHSYTRFKWALTEEQPLIKAYEEKDWSNLFDARTAPIQLSLDHIKALHAKLVYLLKGLSPENMKSFYIHPEGKVKVTVAENIGKYAWHSNHHYAHIKNLAKRMGW
ncbi:YfiT family bacillithiol transferase [Maribacter aestuarii]|uniref:YfiT family bacillithiol transferase n=1 Tax=Maribacter aestuarii TaxID=1130723 RepID=UPI00248C3725|nr:putative metal-dependent hydrolase [Maribacter aestuarii]